MFSEAQNASIISVVDERDYDPTRCIDGGKYSYTTIYIKQADGNYEVHHSTSAKFEYCEACGNFSPTYECPHCGSSPARMYFDKISWGKLVADVKLHASDPAIKIYIDGELEK